MTAQVQITELFSHGDARGPFFTAPPEAIAFVGQVSDMHIVSAKPGTSRGNHYHLHRREALIVMPGAKWSLHWDDGQGIGGQIGTIQRREFSGACAVLVLIPPGASHAVRNDDDSDHPLWLIAISSGPYDPADTVKRMLT
jgi:dTDP-4-dehydrorhamnose 3,5-epimerase-like enzyme